MTTENNEPQSDNPRQNLVTDYRDSGLNITKVELQEFQDHAEAQNHLLLQHNANALLKYPYEKTNSAGQSRICHML